MTPNDRETMESKVDFTIRPAQDKDAGAIALLGSSVFSATFGYSMPLADLEHYLKEAYSLSQIHNDISSPDTEVLVACDNSDQVIGYAQLRKGSSEPCVADAEKPIELLRLYINPKNHGQGIAKVLVRDLESMAREQGYKTMWLGVWEENFKAQKVYERLGYVRVGEHDFVMGECVQTDWIMSKAL